MSEIEEKAGDVNLLSTPNNPNLSVNAKVNSSKSETKHSEKGNFFDEYYVNSKPNTTRNSTNHVTFQRAHKVIYFGYAVLDRRYTLPMLPWIFAEVKRHGFLNREEIYIEVTDSSLNATNSINKSLVFEHKLQSISKFAQSAQDLTCFTYTTRETSTGPSAYHVFQASDENTVLELFSTLREMSKEMLNQTLGPVIAKTTSGAAICECLSSCQQYEVLYLGNLKVPSKRTLPTFIDDGVEKLKLFELEKYKKYSNFSQRQRHGSGASVSSLPHNLEILQKPSENELQQQMDPYTKEDISSSSGVSSCESISHKSSEGINQICCDIDYVFLTPPSSPQDSELSYKSAVPSLVTHSQSMDIALTNQMLNAKKDLELKDLSPYSLITHTQSLDTPTSSEIIRSFKDFDFDIVGRDRVRSCSGDIPRVKQTSLPLYHKNESFVLGDMRRPRAYTSPTSGNHHINRTMLFVIGHSEIYLIGMDKKQMLLSKTFNDISHCSQGTKHLDHFGFVCREITMGGSDHYKNYIFRCHSEKVVDEMMQTLKMAFSIAHQNIQKLSESIFPTSKVFTCESCPMHWFHKLCSDMEGRMAEDAHSKIFKRLDSLPEKDKENIIVKFQEIKNNSFQDQNEMLMMLLREYSEQKQLNHTHVEDKNRNLKCRTDSKSQISKLDIFRQKAKKSLSNSFETILKIKKKNVENEQMRPRASTVGSSSQLEKCQDIHPVLNKERKSFENPITSIATEKVNVSPLTPEHTLKRAAIFQRIKTSSSLGMSQVAKDISTESGTRHMARSKEQIRSLWKKAIQQQIMLIRMNKENKDLHVKQSDINVRRLKLDYDDTSLGRTITAWENFMEDSRSSVPERRQLIDMVLKGVPKEKRGEVWRFLSTRSDEFTNVNETPYKQLLNGLTPDHQSILLDINRTFPQHPFFARQLESGQLSLFNVLKAYSLCDPEVGYCQGTSFVAGILLLHMPEEQAFQMFTFFMFNLNFREQCRRELLGLQIHLYQLERFMHDYIPDLFDHFEKFQVTPDLFAVEWLMTLFASQFSIAFAARLFDFLFLFGSEGLLRISLTLLNTFKDDILKLDGLESILMFIRNDMPFIDLVRMENIFIQAFDPNLDEIGVRNIASKLHQYHIEFKVLHEESLPAVETEEKLRRIQRDNEKIRLDNEKLSELLKIKTAEAARAEMILSQHVASIQSLEAQLKKLNSDISCLTQKYELLQEATEKISKERFCEGNGVDAKMEFDRPKKRSRSGVGGCDNCSDNAP